MLESELLLENCDGGGGGGIIVAGDKEGAGGEEGDRNSAGNRWPREETLALLKVRSDMDVAFRDSSLKGPLWDEVSRKLGELGYHRGAKKCKEKFENIYKYHKRTKEGRSGRLNGKNYRFFEQLEAFDTQFSLPSPPSNKINPNFMTETTTTTTATTNELMIKPTNHDVITTPCTTQNPSFELMSTSTSTTSSSRGNNVKKKRKLEGYFEKLMKEVLKKQEDLQNKFIEAIEKCELDRVAREEAWRTHELARFKKEQEILAQERAIVAAKDAAVIAFLQRVSDQAIPVQLPNNPINPSGFGNGENSLQASSSRWPKAEVEALIRLRTNLDLHYQDNEPKGPLWEEISSAMKKLGYNRNSRRCKEKWENINKYYKRVKESNKKRPEDSKTCPYFHLLESIYERKSKKVDNSDSSGGCNLKPEDILMQMIGQQQPQSLTRRGEIENVDQNQEDEGDDDDDEEEDDNEDNYQVVANYPSSLTNME